MEYTSLGKLPISGPNAAGSDIREDAQYELLLSEIEKLNSISPAAMDWNKVRDISAGILAGKAKDLTVASYLAAALLKTEGLKGLATGVKVIRDLLENFWESMYPALSRMRARRNAIGWWAESVEKDLAGLSGQTWPAADRDSLIADLAAVDSFLAERMDNAPMLISIMNTVERLLSPETPSAPPPIPPFKGDKTEEAGKKDDFAAPAAAAPQAPESLPDDMDLDRALDFGASTLAKAAGILAAQSPHNPLVFKLNRLAAWLPVTDLPPAEGGKTSLPAPDDQELQVLKKLHADGNRADLLEFAEARIGRYLFWLDLNRFSWESLIEMGHADAGNTVLLETQAYAARLPGLDGLAFNDGTPFADNETRSWLGSGSEKGGARRPEKTGIADEMSKARELFREGPLKASLGKIGAVLSRLPSERERLVLKMGFCRVLAELDQPVLARSFGEDILRTIERHNIDTWEPDLAIEGFAAAVFALRRGNGGEERINSLLNRIAVLNPLKALDLI